MDRPELRGTATVVNWVSRHGLSFYTDRMGADYSQLLDLVVGQGEVVSPRGLEVAEVRPLVLTIETPEFCMVKRDNFSKALMFAEMAQVLGGVYDSDLFDAVMPEATRHLQDAPGAYGPRIKDQLQHVVAELDEDPDSRRAQLVIAEPYDLSHVRDTFTPSHPCTSTLQFFIREHRLECHTHMRSWDLVWGLTYDLPVFVTLQRAVAAALKLDLGPYTHTASSGHVYQEHWGLEPDDTNKELPNVTPSFGPDSDPVRAVQEYQQRARSAIAMFTTPNLEGTHFPEWDEATNAWEKKRAAKDSA